MSDAHRPEPPEGGSRHAVFAGDSRPIARARVAYTPRWAFPLVEAIVGLGDWVNVSVMLRGIRERAERDRL